MFCICFWITLIFLSWFYYNENMHSLGFDSFALDGQKWPVSSWWLRKKGLSKEFILLLVFWVNLLNCKCLAIVDISVVFRKQLELLKQDLNLADLDTSKWSWFFLSYYKLPKQDLINRLLKIMIKCILLMPVKIFW